MDDLKLCDSDYRFMSVVWESEPVGSGQLVRLCQDRLGWKKSTTYTVLKKLCDRAFLKNEGSVVSALVPREQVEVFESGYVVDRSFGGSLPAFIAAFTKGRALTAQEAEEIQHLIDDSRKEDAP